MRESDIDFSLISRNAFLLLRLLYYCSATDHNILDHGLCKPFWNTKLSLHNSVIIDDKCGHICFYFICSCKSIGYGIASHIPIQKYFLCNNWLRNQSEK
ncbi:unnamed protein product [Leptidea sinapis]|uniref:Uncharacterized protein n=1 Tax=Leptidea sinapis TaxID=189913 RepID=A0A5E4Q111_9NEOP|nr:unnamed protein product [Leptidea sinapis]